MFEPQVEELTAAELDKKLAVLSFFPHTIVRNGANTSLAPSEMDPGFYDGPEKYKIAQPLQACLQNIMKHNPGLAHIPVALVDLTKDINKPEFAGYFHKAQRFVASVAKIAPMLAAFQLRKDVRVAYANNSATSLPALFDALRDDWAATQKPSPKVKNVPFTKSIVLRDKLVLIRGSPVNLTIAKAPKLPDVFTMPSGGSASSIDFQSTGENYTQLAGISDAFNLAFDPPKGDKRMAAQLAKDRGDSLAVLDALGFLERLRLAMGGVVPASNFAVATIIRDVGYACMTSTLLQSGLYDPAREGGLWLGSNYWNATWKPEPFRGSVQSATAGSLAAFMTLMAQDRLVDSQSSREMRLLLRKTPFPTHPTIVSWFENGLEEKLPAGLIRLALSKLGVLDGLDDCAYFERKLSAASPKILRYVAVGLRARPGNRGPDEMKKLIKLLDDCIVANNP